MYALHYPVIDPTITASERLGIPLPVTGMAFVAGMIVLAWLAAHADTAMRHRLLGRAGQRSWPPASRP